MNRNNAIIGGLIVVVLVVGGIGVAYFQHQSMVKAQQTEAMERQTEAAAMKKTAADAAMKKTDAMKPASPSPSPSPDAMMAH